MKNLYLLALFVFIYSFTSAQNVGVDVAAPQQKLDVAGAIKIGSTATGVAGSLRWNGTEFQFHDGASWITLNANTDDQVLDVIQLNGNDLEISVENDGQATHAVDFSGFLDNTDEQQFDQVTINGSNQLLLSISNDGLPTHVLDLSGYLDDTDNQTFDVINITSDELRLSLEDDGQATHLLDLSPYKDNTDDQVFDVIQLIGTDLQLSLEDDGQATHTVDLSSLADNTDDQQFDVITIASDELRLSLEDDAQATHVLDLSPYKDNTDDQQFDVVTLVADELRLSLEDDGQATHVIDLSGYADNTDDQTIDVLSLAGNTLNISLEDDGVANETLNLSQFMDNTDDQALNDFSVSGNILSLDIEDAGGIQTVNLTPYLDNTDNQEITQFNLSGNTLQITLEDDAGGQETVDLSGYLDNTDDQAVTTFSLSGTDLQLQVEDDAGGLQTIDLDPLRRLLVDDNGDTRVEVEATSNEDQIRFTTDGGEAMRINMTQQVGIGLSAGIENRLVVQGSNSDSRAVLGLRGGNAVTTFTGGPQIAFGYDGNDSFQHFIHTRHNSAGGSTNNAIDFYVTDGTQYNTVTSGSTHVMSLNSGNVGVGETNPTQKLEVDGNSLLKGRVYIGTTDSYFYRDAANRIATPDAFYVQASSPATYLYSTNTYLGNSSGDGTHLRDNYFDWTGGAGGIINTNGRVGVGTTSPSEQLHVVGNTRVSGLGGGGTRLVVADNNGVLSATTSVPTGMGDNLGNHTGTTTLNMNNNWIYVKPSVSVNTGNMGVGWNGSDLAYAIYQEGGAWNSPYPDLMMRFHTGIKLSAHHNYGGIRFYTESLQSAFNNDGNYLYQGWYRPHGNRGMYWEGDGHHLYPSNTTYMRLRSGASNNSGLRYDRADGAVLAYQYANDNWFGVLNEVAEWQLRTRSDNGYSPNLYFDEEGNETFSGNPGNDEGKIEYHSNRFYIASGANSAEIVRFRRSGGDQVMINNSGDVYNYNGWFRPHGDRGIYFQDYGGGWHMTDGTWVRAYNGRSIWTSQWSQADQGMRSRVFDFGSYNDGLPAFTDGQFYRTGGQAELRFDDWFYMRDNSGTIRHRFNSDQGDILLGPNTGWGRSLRLGGNGNVTSEANIATTNGNLHIDSRSGQEIYLNHYNRTWVNVGDPGSTGYMRVGGYHIYDDNSWANNTGAPNDRVYFQNRVGVKGNIGIGGNPWGWTDVRCTNCADAINGNGNLWLTAQDAVRLAGRNTNVSVEFSVWDAVNGYRDRAFATSNANWGQVGTSGQYFYRMYNRYYYAASGYYTFSDKSLKENVETLSGALDKVKKLRGVSYDVKSDSKYYDDKDIESNYNRVGFIAQEVQEVLPQAVRKVDENSEDAPDLLAVDYVAAVPLLVEAIKEQQEMIEALGGGAERTVEDFGSAKLDGESMWVEFRGAFSSQLTDGQVPIVSVTANELGAEIAVIEKSATGFKVRKVGTNPLSFDWIAKARIQVDTKAEEVKNLSQERKLAIDDPAERARIVNYWRTRRALEYRESEDLVKEEEERARNYKPMEAPTPPRLENVADPEGTGPRMEEPSNETPDEELEVPMAEPVEYDGESPSINEEDMLQINSIENGDSESDGPGNPVMDNRSSGNEDAGIKTEVPEVDMPVGGKNSMPQPEK